MSQHDHLIGLIAWGINGSQKIGHVDPDGAAELLDAYVAAERERVNQEWIRRLAAMCDDDWLRRRDRCMELPGTSTRHGRTAAGAWEQAATTVRLLLNEHGYDVDNLDRHDSYMAWVKAGRDRGESEVHPFETDEPYNELSEDYDGQVIEP